MDGVTQAIVREVNAVAISRSVRRNLMAQVAIDLEVNAVAISRSVRRTSGVTPITSKRGERRRDFTKREAVGIRLYQGFSERVNAVAISRSVRRIHAQAEGQLDGRERRRDFTKREAVIKRRLLHQAQLGERRRDFTKREADWCRHSEINSRR